MSLCDPPVSDVAQMYTYKSSFLHMLTYDTDISFSTIAQKALFRVTHKELSPVGFVLHQSIVFIKSVEVKCFTEKFTLVFSIIFQ